MNTTFIDPNMGHDPNAVDINNIEPVIDTATGEITAYYDKETGNYIQKPDNMESIEWYNNYMKYKTVMDIARLHEELALKYKCLANNFIKI